MSHNSAQQHFGRNTFRGSHNYLQHTTYPFGQDSSSDDYEEENEYTPVEILDANLIPIKLYPYENDQIDRDNIDNALEIAQSKIKCKPSKPILKVSTDAHLWMASRPAITADITLSSEESDDDTNSHDVNLSPVLATRASEESDHINIDSDGSQANVLLPPSIEASIYRSRLFRVYEHAKVEDITVYNSRLSDWAYLHDVDAVKRSIKMTNHLQQQKQLVPTTPSTRNGRFVPNQSSPAARRFNQASISPSTSVCLTPQGPIAPKVPANGTPSPSSPGSTPALQRRLSLTSLCAPQPLLTTSPSTKKKRSRESPGFNLDDDDDDDNSNNNNNTDDATSDDTTINGDNDPVLTPAGDGDPVTHIILSNGITIPIHSTAPITITNSNSQSIDDSPILSSTIPPPQVNMATSVSPATLRLHSFTAPPITASLSDPETGSDGFSHSNTLISSSNSEPTSSDDDLPDYEFELRALYIQDNTNLDMVEWMQQRHDKQREMKRQQRKITRVISNVLYPPSLLSTDNDDTIFNFNNDDNRDDDDDDDDDTHALVKSCPEIPSSKKSTVQHTFSSSVSDGVTTIDLTGDDDDGGDSNATTIESDISQLHNNDESKHDVHDDDSKKTLPNERVVPSRNHKINPYPHRPTMTSSQLSLLVSTLSSSPALVKTPVALYQTVDALIASSSRGQSIPRAILSAIGLVYRDKQITLLTPNLAPQSRATLVASASDLRRSPVASELLLLRNTERTLLSLLSQSPKLPVPSYEVSSGEITSSSNSTSSPLPDLPQSLYPLIRPTSLNDPLLLQDSVLKSQFPLLFTDQWPIPDMNPLERSHSQSQSHYDDPSFTQSEISAIPATPVATPSPLDHSPPLVSNPPTPSLDSSRFSTTAMSLLRAHNATDITALQQAPKTPNISSSGPSVTPQIRLARATPSTSLTPSSARRRSALDQAMAQLRHDIDLYRIDIAMLFIGWARLQALLRLTSTSAVRPQQRLRMRIKDDVVFIGSQHKYKVPSVAPSHKSIRSPVPRHQTPLTSPLRRNSINKSPNRVAASSPFKASLLRDSPLKCSPPPTPVATVTSSPRTPLAQLSPSSFESPLSIPLRSSTTLPALPSSLMPSYEGDDALLGDSTDEDGPLATDSPSDSESDSPNTEIPVIISLTRKRSALLPSQRASFAPAPHQPLSLCARQSTLLPTNAGQTYLRLMRRTRKAIRDSLTQAVLLSCGGSLKSSPRASRLSTPSTSKPASRLQTPSVTQQQHPSMKRPVHPSNLSPSHTNRILTPRSVSRIQRVSQHQPMAASSSLISSLLSNSAAHSNMPIQAALDFINTHTPRAGQLLTPPAQVSSAQSSPSDPTNTSNQQTRKLLPPNSAAAKLLPQQYKTTPIKIATRSPAPNASPSIALPGIVLPSPSTSVLSATPSTSTSPILLSAKTSPSVQLPPHRSLKRSCPSPASSLSSQDDENVVTPNTSPSTSAQATSLLLGPPSKRSRSN